MRAVRDEVAPMSARVQGHEQAGWQVVAQCEIDPTARAVLARHWPEAEDYGDGEDA